MPQPRGRKLWLLAALLATARCAGAPAERPTSLDAAEAARLIREHAAFRTPIRVEVWSTYDSPTAATLAGGGYLERADAERVIYRLTEKGRENGVDTTEFEIGIPVYRSPVARLELIQVASVADDPARNAAARVQFDYRIEPTPIGRALIDARSGLRELHGVPAAASGEAQLARFEDGWRLERVELRGCGSCPGGSSVAAR